MDTLLGHLMGGWVEKYSDCYEAVMEGETLLGGVMRDLLTFSVHLSMTPLEDVYTRAQMLSSNPILVSMQPLNYQHWPPRHLFVSVASR
jgi:hypothetical protein